ncbi:MAG: TIGR02147 family protein, partial [Bdellovibrionia bacterium]
IYRQNGERLAGDEAKTEPILIFSYHDYREYLKDCLEYLRTSEGVSLRFFAAELKVSPAFLSYVLRGHRDLTKPVRNRLAVYLKLDRDERKYLELLTVIADSDNAEIRIEAFEKVVKFREFRKLNPQETETYLYMTQWYFVAIREMVALPGFEPDPEWIQERLSFPIHQKKIAKALQFLFKFGFIVKDEKGKCFLPQKKIDCVGGVYRMALSQFHKQAFSLLPQSIESIPRAKRYIMSSTLAIPEESFDEFKAILEDCLKKISELGNSKSNPDSVYHIGFMGIPFARGKGVK